MFFFLRIILAQFLPRFRYFAFACARVRLHGAVQVKVVQGNFSEVRFVDRAVHVSHDVVHADREVTDALAAGVRTRPTDSDVVHA